MGLYRTLVRPAVFSLPPEAGHRLVDRFLRLPLPWRSIGGVPRDPRLRTSLAGIDVANPIGLAAGFDKRATMLPNLDALGFGFVVIGTVTRRARTGNPKPRIARRAAAGAIVNAMGLPNPGADAVAARLAAMPRTGPRFASIADESVQDAVGVLQALDPHVDGLELNASCPNVVWGRDRDTEHHLRELVEALSARTAHPVFVKLPPLGAGGELDAVLALAAIATEAGAAGLVCGNSLPVEEDRLEGGRGGLSGRPLLPGTVRAVAAVRGEVGSEVVVQACGGISAPEDVRRCLQAGANAVQIYTALIYEGPRVVRQLCAALPAAAQGGPRKIAAG